MLKKDAAAHVYDVYAASWMVVMVYGWCSFGMFGDLWTYFNYERLHSFVCVGMAQTRHLHPSWETTRFVDLVALAICATMMGQLARFAVWWFVLAQNVGHLSLVIVAPKDLAVMSPWTRLPASLRSPGSIQLCTKHPLRISLRHGEAWWATRKTIICSGHFRQ